MSVSKHLVFRETVLRRSTWQRFRLSKALQGISYRVKHWAKKWDFQHVQTMWPKASKNKVSPHNRYNRHKFP